MSRRFDSKVNSFSAEGRLLQVEYAIEAINKSRPGIGILIKDGAILGAVKDVVSALLEQSRQSEKIYQLDKNIHCVVSGVNADANYLIDYAREEAQKYRFSMREYIPVEQLVIDIADQKQYYTQFGGSRLFGAAFIYAGYDSTHGFQLYNSDPSGNYAGWKATAIGTNSVAANSFLKDEYEQNLELDKGLDLVIKAISKTLDTSTPTADKIELLVLRLDENQQVRARFLNEKEINELLKRNDILKEKVAE